MGQPKKKKQFKLTQNNYYSSERPHVSNSQVSDYLKSKEYFWRKNVLKEIPFGDTPNMRIGSMVDDMLSGRPMRFQVKVLKRDDPERYEEQKNINPELLITEREWNEAIAHAKSLMSQPCYKWYAETGAKFQYVLEAKLNEVPVCGMADVITETRSVVFIDDFKVVSKLKIATLDKWYFNCLEMGYFRQLAAYKWMWQQMHPNDIRPIICHHLISAKECEGLYKVLPIVLPEELLVAPLEEFKLGVEGIANLLDSKDWQDPPVKWSDAKILKNPMKAPEENDVTNEEEFYMEKDES